MKPTRVLWVVLAVMSLSCSAITSMAGVGGGPALVKDDFSNSSSGWGTGTDAQSSIEYQNGGLHMHVYKANFITWSSPDSKTYQNVHLEVTAKNDNPNSPGSFGLMCNQQGNDASYYYFAVTPAGAYVIGLSQTGHDDVFLTNNGAWGSSSLIAKSASSYRIGADCGAGSLVLYVDGKKIDSATDTTFSSGGVGLFLWSGDNPVGEITYDDFVMTQIK